jgi:hypothetical protein
MARESQEGEVRIGGGITVEAIGTPGVMTNVKTPNISMTSRLLGTEVVMDIIMVVDIIIIAGMIHQTGSQHRNRNIGAPKPDHQMSRPSQIKVIPTGEGDEKGWWQLFRNNRVSAVSYNSAKRVGPSQQLNARRIVSNRKKSIVTFT